MAHVKKKLDYRIEGNFRYQNFSLKAWPCPQQDILNFVSGGMTMPISISI